MTKYLTREVGDKHMSALGGEIREGRAQKASRCKVRKARPKRTLLLTSRSLLSQSADRRQMDAAAYDYGVDTGM